ncbi:MAG: hypothetical protein K2X59_13340 [Sphingomonas sp.]|nr:hypothetical protein [Sphingomonas sp.]
MKIDHKSSFASSANITELSISELALVDGGVNWYAVGRVVGTAARLGGVAGDVGLLTAVAVVGGAPAIDYALDGKFDLID